MGSILECNNRWFKALYMWVVELSCIIVNCNFSYTVLTFQELYICLVREKVCSLDHSICFYFRLWQKKNTNRRFSNDQSAFAFERWVGPPFFFFLLFSSEVLTRFKSILKKSIEKYYSNLKFIFYLKRELYRNASQTSNQNPSELFSKY